MKWKKIFSNYISHKGLLFKIEKKLLQFNNDNKSNTNNNPI